VNTPHTRELALLRPLVRQVGGYVRSMQEEAAVSSKAGGEPVTEADREANRLLIGALCEAFPGDFVMGEESFEDDQKWTTWERIWFVDPIDGTREYIEGRDDYSVMVGLAIRGEAALGVVYQPRSDRLYFGGPGMGSFLEADGDTRPLSMGGPVPIETMTAALSRSHAPPRIHEALERLGIHKVVHHGSVGVKVALVTAGLADVYIQRPVHRRLGPPLRL
jgi:3'(2'), 5'-bisphosphate nucleotidase